MQVNPSKSAGPTPWLDMVYDHCEEQGGYLAIESFPLGHREHEILPHSEFVLLAYWGDPPVCKGTTSRTRRIETAAEHLCRQFDLDFADA